MAIDPQIRSRLMAQLGADYAHAYPKLIEENYPHILEKITNLTNPLEGERFFEELLLTQRTDRHGFSVEAFGELLALINVFRKRNLLRVPPRKDGDIWNWAAEINYEAGTRHTE
jgi:hypothetical protein